MFFIYLWKKKNADVDTNLRPFINVGGRKLLADVDMYCRH